MYCSETNVHAPTKKYFRYKSITNFKVTEVCSCLMVSEDDILFLWLIVDNCYSGADITLCVTSVFPRWDAVY